MATMKKSNAASDNIKVFIDWKWDDFSIEVSDSDTAIEINGFIEDLAGCCAYSILGGFNINGASQSETRFPEQVNTLFKAFDQKLIVGKIRSLLEAYDEFEYRDFNIKKSNIIITLAEPTKAHKKANELLTGFFNEIFQIKLEELHVVKSNHDNYPVRMYCYTGNPYKVTGKAAA